MAALDLFYFEIPNFYELENRIPLLVEEFFKKGDEVVTFIFRLFIQNRGIHFYGHN